MFRKTLRETAVDQPLKKILTKRNQHDRQITELHAHKAINESKGHRSVAFRKLYKKSTVK